VSGGPKPPIRAADPAPLSSQNLNHGIAIGAVIAAALITAGQLLFVNDTVAASIGVSLWVLVGTAAICTGLLPLTRWLTSK